MPACSPKCFFLPKGFQIDISKEHGNWLNVGEIIRSIQKPISIYVDEIVKALHEKLCKDLPPVAIGKCITPDDCNKKTKPSDLCTSCKPWFDKLNGLHENGNNPAWRNKITNNPSWHKNCNGAKWPDDHWEVAKFFMSALGSNLDTIKDHESTDISSLLNVLEWLNNVAFLGKTRVNVDVVRKLRSEVRNSWAHAPQQELSDEEMAQGFSIATDFLEDLETVWCHVENGKCLKHLKELETNKVTKVTESELQSLLLQHSLLDDIKEEITAEMEVEHSSDKNTIEENEEKLENLERALNECSQRMSEFKNFKDNMNEQFNRFAEDLKSFHAIPEDIHKIRNSIGQIRDDLAKMNERQKEERKPTSCLPDRLSNFTARDNEIGNVITSLVKEKKAVVSLHGGPGFGKTSIAIEVSHKLNENPNISVVFSQLTFATNVDEMIRQLCIDVGVNYEDDPKSSLILWLRKIESKVIFVMDNIDNLIHDKDIDPSHFYEFIRLLRKNSSQTCQIITTSRISYEIPELVTVEVKIEEMDDGACMKLLKNHCPGQDDEFLRELAKRCGKIPLAMCVAGPRVKEFKKPHELLQHLQQQPMKTLQSRKTNKYVDQAIKMSYQKCSDEDKKILIRLAVFEGSFGKDAAETVIEKDSLDAANILHGLVSQSLIKQLAEFRYSFHLLIKEFLVEQRNGENEMKKQAMRAELLMVEYYLKLGYHLTMESYSKDGYKESREALKEEAHHVQNVLEICCQKNELILECLAQSEVYTTSARHFSLFVRTIIPASIVNKFLQRCAEIANEKKQHAIKINFDCLLADNERVKSYSKPDIVEFNAKMEKIQEEFEAHYEDIKEDKSLCAQYYYQYGRYLLRKSDSHRGKEQSDLRREACKQLEESLRLRKNLTRTSSEKQRHAQIADEIFSLLRLGDARKKILGSKRADLEEAQKCYEEVIKLSQENLGEHELTASCYKGFGDLLLTKGKSKLAEEKYITAKKMRDDLDLNASKTHILLLSSLGRCLTINGQATEAIEILEGARDMAQKLSESDVSNVCKTKVYASLAIAYDTAGNNTDAVYYAEKALEFEEAIYDNSILEKLRKIVSNDV